MITATPHLARRRAVARLHHRVRDGARWLCAGILVALFLLTVLTVGGR